MRRVCAGVLFLTLCIGPSSAFAQTSPPAARSLSVENTAKTSPSPTATPIVFSAQTLADAKRLQEAALKSDYAWRQVAHLSDNIGPRLSGSLGAAKAVEYVASELKAIGCKVQVQKVMVPHWVRGEETGALVSYPGQAEGMTQNIVLCALGPSVATDPKGLTAEVIVAHSFNEFSAIPPERVNGKIVLFNYPFDQRIADQGRSGDAYSQAVAYRTNGAATAARKGAVGCLVRSVGGANFRLPHTGWTQYVDDAKKIPAAAVCAEDADLITRLAQQGPVTMKLTLTPQTLPEAESANVIGDVEGSEHPEQIVLVSGHLDSWDLGTGAIDDGAGVAASMEVVNLVKKLNLKPKRTIRMVAWMNEENGSAGSKGYEKELGKDFANHFAVMETDNGAGHPIGLNVKGPALKKMLEPVAAILQDFGAGALNLVEHCGADISLMEQAGVPALSPIQDSRTYFHYHHSAADTLDKIVPKELAENAAVITVAAYALANSEQPLPRPAVEKKSGE